MNDFQAASVNKKKTLPATKDTVIYEGENVFISI